jgi:hypothetical protein
LQGAFYKYCLELADVQGDLLCACRCRKVSTLCDMLSCPIRRGARPCARRMMKILQRIKQANEEGVYPTDWPKYQHDPSAGVDETAQGRLICSIHINNVEALWPRINATYKYDSVEGRSVRCDPKDPAAAYEMSFRMIESEAKTLWAKMVEAYNERKQAGWPDMPNNPL